MGELLRSTFGSLRSIWGRHAADVIAVGDNAAIHFDGSSWSLLPQRADEIAGYQVAVGNAQRIWLGGYVRSSAGIARGPKLGRWDGATFVDDLAPSSPYDLPFELDKSFVGAGWAQADDDVWIGLPQLMHWDGQRWSHSAVALNQNFVSSLWGTTKDLWALVESGHIFRRPR